MKSRSLIVVSMCVTLAVGAANAGAAPELLRLTGVGPVTLGMNESAAVATGWLANRGPGCELASPVPSVYDFRGPKAPTGLRGNATFQNGKLINISFRKGVRTRLGVRPAVSTARSMVRAYRLGGFVVSDRTSPIFGRFVTARRGGKSIEAVIQQGKVFALSIPLTQICD